MAGIGNASFYQADSDDLRVAGLVFASPAVGFFSPGGRSTAPCAGRELVDEGAGEELLRLPPRSFLSFVSAATHLALAEWTRVLIVNGDHEYVGEEAQVAQTIAGWADAELLRD